MNAAITVSTYLSLHPNDRYLTQRLQAYTNQLEVSVDLIREKNREPALKNYEKVAVNTVDLMTDDKAFVLKAKEFLEEYLLYEERCRARCQSMDVSDLYIFHSDSDLVRINPVFHRYMVSVLNCNSRCRTHPLDFPTGVDLTDDLWLNLEYTIKMIHDEWKLEDKLLELATSSSAATKESLCDFDEAIRFTQTGLDASPDAVRSIHPALFVPQEDLSAMLQ